MKDNLRSLHGRKQLTRIRVTGSAGIFRVQHGDDAPVTVRVRGDSLSCECGRPSCLHLTSLLMCGFIEGHQEAQKAA